MSIASINGSDVVHGFIVGMQVMIFLIIIGNRGK